VPRPLSKIGQEQTKGTDLFLNGINELPFLAAHSDVGHSTAWVSHKCVKGLESSVDRVSEMVRVLCIHCYRCDGPD
jgi:hypothetical protein